MKLLAALAISPVALVAQCAPACTPPPPSPVNVVHLDHMEQEACRYYGAHSNGGSVLTSDRVCYFHIDPPADWPYGPVWQGCPAHIDWWLDVTYEPDPYATPEQLDNACRVPIRDNPYR